MNIGLRVILLAIAVISFVLAFAGISLDGHSLVSLGLAFFAGAFIVDGGRI